jgi:1-acyl-sn-glycerol-3-phosphate acyltransferase
MYLYIQAMRHILHFILTVFQWPAAIFLVLFFGSTTALIGQFDKKTKKWCARWYRYFCKAILLVTRVKAVIIGQHHINRDQNYLVCANHQGLFDIIAMTAAIPLPLLFVSKPDYFRIPVMGQGMRASGHLEVTRHDTEHDKATMDLMAQYLTEGRTYVMYPEGTRTKDETF